MKKLITLFLSAIILLSACGHKQVTLETIEANWNKLDNLSYEVSVLRSEGQPPLEGQVPQIKFYLKDKNKLRMEASQAGQQETILITNDQKGLALIYYPEQDSYLIIPNTDMTQGLSADINAELDKYFAELREKYSIVGDDQIDGKNAVILEGEDEGFLQRLWLWTETSAPLKVQRLTMDRDVLDDVEFKNVSVDRLPQNLFDIPLGAEEISFEDVFGDFGPEFEDVPNQVIEAAP